MTTKDTNPKDAIGVKKWRQYCTVPATVLWEVGVGMLEGAMKYGRHNYRVSGVRASVYVDAAKGHIDQWWEGEDIDDLSNLSHITKAICSLVVLRDAMIQDMLNDDRPPKAKLDKVRDAMQKAVEDLFERYPEPLPPYVEGQLHRGGPGPITVINEIDQNLIREMLDLGPPRSTRRFVDGKMRYVGKPEPVPVIVNISAGRPGDEPTVEVVQGDLTSGAHVTVNFDASDHLTFDSVQHILRKNGWPSPQIHVKSENHGEG